MKKFLVLISMCAFNYANATNYYFSSISGNDSRTPAQANNPSTPWKTLIKLNSFISSLKFGDSVLLKRGETFNGSISITSSGSANLPIVFSAYGSGARPVINGFTAITGWSSLGNNIYESYNASFGSVVNMVTINDVQQAQGRYPNTNINKGYLSFESHGTNSIIDNQLSSATDWTGAEVVVRSKRWTLDRCAITSQKGTTISYSPSLSYVPYDNYGYFIQNHVKTLDLPGEWYYNPSTKKMDVFSNPLKFNASTVDVLININYQNNIVFDNLAFTGSNSKAFNLYYAQNILIKNCDILFSGIDGIFGASTTNLSIVNNTITNTNNNAINLNYNCNSSIIRSNVIKNNGLYPGLGASGNGSYQAVTVNGRNNLVEYNNIDSTGFTAIRFAQGDSNVIKNNFISNFTLTKDDGGGINSYEATLSNFKGTKIIGNIIQNGIGTSEGTNKPGTSSSNGIYMDNNLLNILIDGNTVINCGRSGIFLHNAPKTTVINNTLYNNATQLLIINDISSPNSLLRNDIIKNNILFSKLATQPVLNVSSMAADINLIGVMDSNYYCRPIDDNLIFNASYVNATGTRVDQILDLQGWQTTYNLDKSSKKTNTQIPAYITTTTGPNLFSNGYFNSNISGLYSSSSSSWINNKLDGGTFQATNTSTAITNYQVIMGVGAIDSTKSYLLRFSAQSLKDSILNTYLRTSGAPYNKLSDTKVLKVTTNRTNNEFLFTLKGGAAASSIIIETKCPKITFWLDNVELYEANSTITNPDDYILFQYNASQVQKTIPLQGTYVDVYNQSYTNNVVLAPYSSIILISTNAPTNARLKSLPLSFLDFSGEMKDKSVNLEWETTNENNTDYFQVERSSYDLKYTALGKIKAGNIPGTLQYNFTDNAPENSINYYRLKQFDLDGKFIYSKVIHFENSSIYRLSVSPNPVKTKINLQVSGSQSNGDINYYIFSASGSLVKIGHGNSANSLVTIDVTNLNGGIYLIKAVSGGLSVTKEFLKL